MLIAWSALRVRRKVGDGLHRGDALAASDHPVAANELLGRVTYLIRAGKLVALPAKLGAIDNLIAEVVRRSTPAARAFVYLNRIRQV